MDFNEFCQFIYACWVSLCKWWSLLVGGFSWELLKSFANSTFTTSLIGALAGAFAGATVAQHIAERNKRRDELLREIRNTNAAIAIAFGICNSLLALKKQQVLDLKTNFDAKRAEVFEFERKRIAGELENSEPFYFVADYRTLQAHVLPTDILRTVVLEKLLLVGRPLNLVMMLDQTGYSLGQSIAKRNQLIESYKSGPVVSDQIIRQRYFGLPYNGGSQNLDYPGTIEAIYSQTDDGIFFSHLLCNDLHLHGGKLLDEFRLKFKKNVPRISKVDFTDAIKTGLMPSENDYTHWFTAFVNRIESSDHTS